MGAPPQVKALNCPNCGAPLALRGFAHTLTIVCGNCNSILDAKDPALHVLQQFQAAQRIEPRIPLGTRGKLRGDLYEVIGFQVRTIHSGGQDYSWAEYLLFNPYKGFRYLTEYQGHWNDVATLNTLPEATTDGGRPAARAFGEVYKHFQTAVAETTYVLGEFPWQVRVGEQVTAMDFVHAPRMLSQERTPSEVVWSLGEYVPGPRIWEAFKLPGKPPHPVGVYANQPSPYKGSVKQVWLMFGLLMAGLFLIAQLFFTFSRNEEVFRGAYHFSARDGGEPSFVTTPFELKGRPADVELTVNTDLSNNWAYFGFALINQDTGQAYDFGQEVSYYSGTDSDGAWTEGGARETILVPTIPAGRYYLRVEPEMDASAQPVSYSLTVRRDVPSISFILIAGLLLLIPPIWVTVRAFKFEGQRWSDSDYAPGGGDD
jgi:hypothetical protein